MKTLVFLGDSITDCYHNFDPENLGNGYVRFIYEHLKRTDIKLINKGVDGFTLPALKRMYKQQISSLMPDCLTILIGINDIGVIKNTGLDPDFVLKEFKLSYKAFLNDIRKSYSGPIIMMEPFLFPHPEKYSSWFDPLTKMNHILKEIAAEYHLCFIPLWEDLLSAAQTNGYNAITTDGIHLTEKGHQIIADKWIQAYKEGLV